MGIFEKKEKQRPIKVLSHNGLEAAIWANPKQSGGTEYRVSWSKMVPIGKNRIGYRKSVKQDELTDLFHSLRDVMVYLMVDGHLDHDLFEKLTRYHRSMFELQKDLKVNGLKPV